MYEEVSYTGIILKNSIKYYLDDLNVPVIINADIGHTNPVMTIVNGSIVKISYDSKYEIETFYE